MGRPLLVDPPISSNLPHPASSPPRTDPPAQAPSSPASNDSDSDSTVIPTSPFYGLAPEVVALLRPSESPAHTRTTDSPAARALDARIDLALNSTEPSTSTEPEVDEDEDAQPCPPPSRWVRARPFPSRRPEHPRIQVPPTASAYWSGIARAHGEAIAASQTTEDFASRFQALARTLDSLAERAGLLYPPPNPPSPPVTTAAASLETPTLARHTDGIRNTVRQLLLASRRVNDAVERHRQRQLILDPAQPLPVVLPDRSLSPSPRHPASASNLDPLGPPFTSSPLPLSRTSASPAPSAEAENYPGERAQLLRIEQLQADIASRANELRDLRERSLELERAQRAIARRAAFESSDSEDGGVEVVAAGGREAGPFQPFAVARRPGVGRECLRPDKSEEERRKRKEYVLRSLRQLSSRMYD